VNLDEPQLNQKWFHLGSTQTYLPSYLPTFAPCAYLPTYLPLLIVPAADSRVQWPIGFTLNPKPYNIRPYPFAPVQWHRGWFSNPLGSRWLAIIMCKTIVAFYRQWGHRWCGIAVSLKMAKLQKTTPTFSCRVKWNRLWILKYSQLYSRFSLRLDYFVTWRRYPIVSGGACLASRHKHKANVTRHCDPIASGYAWRI
jgi:hypothetical protein